MKIKHEKERMTIMKLTTDMKTLLRHLLDYGYTYLAKDPGNNAVYAYTAKPQ